ncbi:protein OBERON 4-like [Olea europaea var. sylvestris]|uniref:protein OBERON 4-like n=1 Tax=Olea europaea var. sylvestris TaxID=158386 RepID=UPI000C1D4268|nr:protein OBERON 4-like [Olea europaea var. sylvestris]
MKRLKSSDDLDSYGEKGVIKDWGRREEDPGLHRSSSHRSSYYKSSESGRKGLSSSSSRYDRLEDDRDSSRSVRKCSDYDMDCYDRRKSYDRHREGNERGILSSSPRVGYGKDRIHRSESFSGPRREFPKGFRSESKRLRREGSVSSWRRFSGGKDGDDGNRSSGSELARGNRVELEDVGKVKSPQGPRDAKSPAWSKDSVSDQSKSFEVKRSEDLPVDSGAPSSEREEGELEPDPQPALSPKQAAGKLNSSRMELHHELHIQEKDLQQKENSSPLETGDMSKVGSHEEPAEVGTLEDVQDITNNVNELPDGKDSSLLGISGSGDENEASGDNGGGNDEEEARRGIYDMEDADTTFSEEPTTVQKEQGEDKGTDLDVQAANTDVPKVNKGFAEETAVPLIEEIAQNLKDKGKSIAVSPSNGTHILETGLEVENKTRGLTTFEDAGFEGPITRGFEFFSNDPVKKHEKVELSPQNTHKDEKLALDLSLSLPNVLLPIGAQNRGQDPGSPSHARSAQSFPSTFHTNSDGFTASMSFSGSQQFTHNPSCSLTYDAYDYEKSVGSRPIFQGVDWKALSSDDQKNKEVPIYQGTSIGNSLHHQSQASQGNSSGQPVLQHLRTVEGSSKLPISLDRQLSVNKHIRGAQSQQINDIRSPSQSIGSHENRPGYSKDRRPVMKDRDNASSHRISNPEGKEQALVVGPDFAESIVTMIVAEPLHTMAIRFNEMTEQHVTCVKDYVREIILSPGKQWQLSALQKALRNRQDSTLDMLVKSHVSQLEILVALKTGLQEFLHPNCNVPSSDLAEIFLNLRCRNLTCRSLLPVDECDCKICAQKNGFCRECMCLVCSKFDMASNTCSWVGCDVCLHWCHADCGLRESYIRNGRCASGAQGTTEMQFHCVACDHPSEMFGFVKEVFQNYVKEWTAETLTRELEYVRRIFSASEDIRGKQLHEIASQMLSKLANRAYLQEVRNHILSFLNESDFLKLGFVPTESKKDLPTTNKEGSNGIAGSSQGPMWLKSVSSDKAPRLEKSVGLLSSFDDKRDDKYKMNMDLRIGKEPVYDELESIVRIKQAEAKMFQARADDARREAEALNRIAITKNERIEEEYTTRIAKLRLAEADEMHKQKVEELQGLERAYQEYFNMKMRMEADIKDLLLKMEATRRNLTM